MLVVRSRGGDVEEAAQAVGRLVLCTVRHQVADGLVQDCRPLSLCRATDRSDCLRVQVRGACPRFPDRETLAALVPSPAWYLHQDSTSTTLQALVPGGVA
ncbi:hypothetical protein ACFYVL_40420 [Streptomyces sp. NPDC004111]|uniref:hypothetical protein n=1 Tax=Streptomyces sp. NPDC004111 TaxID=3364690 RepID=UPI003697CFC4